MMQLLLRSWRRWPRGAWLALALTSALAPIIILWQSWTRDSEGVCRAESAIAAHDLSRLRNLVQQHPSFADGKCRGLTLLSFAVSANDVGALSVLLDAGADPNQLDDDYDSAHHAKSPLHLAAGIGNVEMVQLLLRHGAKPTLLDTDGRTAIDYAVKSGRNETAALLRAAADDLPS
jgi:ankyrin repeat protein